MLKLKRMLISDKIYGDFEIMEPVLLELINSRALQRLKGISQMGPPAEFYHIPVYTRYEHSIGAMLLLRKLGAALDEQIAGLLHDASHTAFSHVIDFLWGDSATEDFQDNNHLSALRRFGVEEILKGYGFDIKKIADLKNFSLLDREIPQLCADRIDYSLRQFYNSDMVRECVESLVRLDDNIVFTNFEAAKKFSEKYAELNRENWGGFESVSRYHQLALILKEAIDKHILEADDLWQDDQFVINKLYDSGDDSIISKLEKMKEKTTSVRFGIRKAKKFRYVDPDILCGGKIISLSALDKDYADMLARESAASITGTEI